MRVLLARITPDEFENPSPPISLGYLAAALPEHQIKIVSSCNKYDGMFEDVIKYFKPEVVGFQCYSNDIHRLAPIIEGIKNTDSEIVTVLGGHHASAMPIETLNHIPQLDYIIKGEGEASFSELLLALESKGSCENVPGLYFRKGNTVSGNQVVFISDLDKVPMPAWDLLEPQKYPGTLLGRYRPSLPIVLSRGCPFRCTFCAGHNVLGRTIRYRSPETVEQEIRFLHKKYGIQSFDIHDENALGNLSKALPILEILEETHKKLGVRYRIFGIRSENINSDIAKKLSDSGVYKVATGIESGNDEVLKKIKKGITLEKIRKGVRFLKDADIEVHGSFIIGLPDETREEINQTLKFSRSIGLTTPSFSIFVPLPGSEGFELFKQKGLVTTTDILNQGVGFASKRYGAQLDLTYLRKKKIEAYLRFFLRPIFLVKFLYKHAFVFWRIKELFTYVKIRVVK